MRLPQFRYSLTGLMALVAFVALGCAALRVRNDAWASSMFTLALMLQMAAVLCTVLLRGPARAAWMGFLVFGGGYLLVSSGLWNSADLITHRGLAWLESRMHAEAAQTTTDISFATAPLVTTWSTADTMLATRQLLLLDAATGRTAGGAVQTPFMRIGHSVLSVLLGLLGAMLAAWIYAAGRAHEQPRPAA